MKVLNTIAEAIDATMQFTYNLYAQIRDKRRIWTARREVRYISSTIGQNMATELSVQHYRAELELTSMKMSGYSRSELHDAMRSHKAGWAEVSPGEPLGAMSTRILGSDVQSIIKPPRA